MIEYIITNIFVATIIVSSAINFISIIIITNKNKKNNLMFNNNDNEETTNTKNTLGGLLLLLPGINLVISSIYLKAALFNKNYQEFVEKQKEENTIIKINHEKNSSKKLPKYSFKGNKVNREQKQETKKRKRTL
ncbi:MAG: hypothetical protein Q4G04_05220 [bacterium]|nr:hypothetical protein [bacterium]